jgi:hypothetical protein
VKSPEVPAAGILEDLDLRWEMAINAELDGLGIVESAAKAGVDRRTLYRWREKEEFKAARAAMRAERRDVRRAVLEDAAMVGIATLKDVASSSKDDKARVAAANSLIDRSMGSAPQRVEMEHSGGIEVADLDAARAARIAREAELAALQATTTLDDE